MQQKARVQGRIESVNAAKDDGEVRKVVEVVQWAVCGLLPVGAKKAFVAWWVPVDCCLGSATGGQ